MPIKRVPTVAKDDNLHAAPSTDFGADDVVKVRMYRHGLGDCFLVRLRKDSAQGTFNVLIDCGLITAASNPANTMQEVATSIAADCGNRLDLVILTHEHWDHVSGFSTQQAQEVFDQIDMGEVWYAWTEDPKSKLGKKLRHERESKLAALEQALVALHAKNTSVAKSRATRVESLLRFFGADDASMGAAPNSAIGKTRAAFEYLAQRRGVKIRYCRPSDSPVRFRGVSGVRAYVLGPPEDEGLLKRSAPRKSGTEVYELGADMAFDANLLQAFKRAADGERLMPGGIDCPFDDALCRTIDGAGRDPSEQLRKLIAATWSNQDEDWRRIDEDWTAAAETLALNLDSHTNNTCLVVAFELMESGKVLLFAADAQVGNWLSWQDLAWQVTDNNETQEVTGPDLLRRTAFYKVGHHGSHNATLRALGLEQMESDELIAFVPVCKEQAEKSGWHQMPFQPLMKRLKEKTLGRVVISDKKAKAPSARDLDGLSRAEYNDFVTRLTCDSNDLYYEFTVSK